jgi:hypothetical protein
MITLPAPAPYTPVGAAGFILQVFPHLPPWWTTVLLLDSQKQVVGLSLLASSHSAGLSSQVTPRTVIDAALAGHAKGMVLVRRVGGMDDHEFSATKSAWAEDLIRLLVVAHEDNVLLRDALLVADRGGYSYRDSAWIVLPEVPAPQHMDGIPRG